MALSSKTTRDLAEILIGDKGEIFPYMSGPVIVDFFNETLGRSDVYQWGAAPTRWRYAEQIIIEAVATGQADRLFTGILSTNRIMTLYECSDVDALEHASKARSEMNRILKPEGFYLTENGGRIVLSKIDDDLVLIGKGGFAEAYLQKSTGLVIKKLNRELAVDPKARHRFKREFSIMQNLGDLEGVLQVYDFDDKSMTYTMERGEQTLDELLRSTLPDATRLLILKQTIETMAKIHNMDIVHRDISPSNIFVVKGHIKIADFGLGKNLDSLYSYQTTDTANYGQFFYCSPEQLIMLKDGDKRSDVFSLGRLINFALTGNPMDESHPFRSVVEKATSLEPDNRYQDASELYEGLIRREQAANDAESISRIRERAKQGIYDEDVEQWINDLTPTKMCKELIAIGGLFTKVLARFACTSDSHAAHVVDSLAYNMREACGNSFEAADPFSDLAFDIIRNNAIPFDVKERACRILSYVAYYVNRYHAQHLVEQLIEDGIDPLLEEEINKRPSIPY